VLWTLRRAEAAALRWPDVDLETGTVFVKDGKGGKSALTLLPPAAQAALRAWQAECRRTTGPVFPHRGTGGHATSDAMWGRVKRLLTALGLARPGRGAHAFRRTMATLYLEQHENDLIGLRDLLRHESMSTTELYVFIDSAKLSARLAAVDL
jgi:integrase